MQLNFYNPAEEEKGSKKLFPSRLFPLQDDKRKQIIADGHCCPAPKSRVYIQWPGAENYNFHLSVVKSAMRERIGTASERGVTPSLPEIMLQRMQIWFFIHSVLNCIWAPHVTRVFEVQSWAEGSEIWMGRERHTWRRVVVRRDLAAESWQLHTQT